MARLIWRGDFDALIAYQSTASVLVGIVGWLAGCPLRVVHQTCTPAEMPRLLRFLDLIAGTLGLYSANIVNSASDLGGVCALSGALSPLHDPDRARPRRAAIAGAAATATRRRFGLPQSQPLLLNVGRLTEQKNQDVLIRALPACRRRISSLPAPAPRTTPSTSLPSRSASRAGCTCSVRCRPRISPISTPRADLFVFPSIWETFGLAAAEAAMAGMPMVVADLAGAARSAAVPDGAEPVAFVAPHNVEGWISAIGIALATPPAAPMLLEFRPRYRPQIFAAAHDRKLSESVRRPSAAAAIAAVVRLAAGGGRSAALMARARGSGARRRRLHCRLSLRDHACRRIADTTSRRVQARRNAGRVFRISCNRRRRRGQGLCRSAFSASRSALESVRFRRTAS